MERKFKENEKSQQDFTKTKMIFYTTHDEKIFDHKQKNSEKLSNLSNLAIEIQKKEKKIKQQEIEFRKLKNMDENTKVLAEELEKTNLEIIKVEGDLEKQTLMNNILNNMASVRKHDILIKRDPYIRSKLALKGIDENIKKESQVICMNLKEIQQINVN